MQVYRQFSRALKKRWPKYKVEIRRLKLADGKLGLCTKMSSRHFLIRVTKEASENFAIDILMHEWAHILAWDVEQDHGPEWGLAYSRVYQFWESWINPDTACKRSATS